MKCRKISLAIVLMMGFSVHAQDELSGEIDKLESGQIESESVVPDDPSQSASDVENELNEEFGINEKSAAPEELPEEVAGEDEPVVEKTKSSEELDQEAEEEAQEQQAQDFKTIDPPPPEEIEDSLAPVEEIAEDEAPAPVIKNAEPEYADTLPDDFEERMHRIYSQFYSEATSESAWTQIAGEKIKETYTVQPGDTLWDISVTFFGNGHYWPKVWQMNDGITNPHLVSPGYALKFVPGQIDQAPQLNITGQETEAPSATEVVPDAIATPGAAVAANVTPPTPEPDPVPVIPPPEKIPTPVLTKLPPSLPYIKGSSDSGFDNDGFDFVAVKAKIQTPKVYLPSYLVEEKPEGVGKIVEMNEDDDTTATLYETVFIEMVGGATIGEKLLVFSVGDRIKDTAGRKMGYPFIQEAEVQIQELVNKEKDIYKGIVVRSISNAKVGSSVSRGTMVVGDIEAHGIATPIDAEVVGGHFDNERTFLGYQDIIYLNKGSNEGVKEGQTFTILKSVRDRKKNTLVEALREQVAKVKILKTTPQRSTGIVIHSNQFVGPGDFIGAQARLPTPEDAKSIEIESAKEDSPDEESDSEFESDLE